MMLKTLYYGGYPLLQDNSVYPWFTPFVRRFIYAIDSIVKK